MDAKLTAEDDAKLAENIRKQKEADLALEAEKAPDKEKLTKWIKNLELPTPSVQNGTSGNIQMKFAGFKKWALAEIEKL